MRTTIAATFLAVLPLFAQYENLCISAEEGHAQFRADNSGRSLPHGSTSTGSSRPSAKECLASAQPVFAEPKPGGPVSFYKLTHKISAKARTEFRKGVLASLAGDDNSAEEHYRKAINLKTAVAKWVEV